MDFLEQIVPSVIILVANLMSGPHIASFGDSNGHLRVDGGCGHDRAHSHQHSSRSYGGYFILASDNRLLVADRAVPRLRKDSPLIVSVESVETRVSA